MKIHDCQQNTPEWEALRSGIPTASEFDSILTRGGKKSESRERYMLTLLAERLMGHACQEHKTAWMERGSQAEASAVRFYELQKDLDTVPVGFVTNDAETWGASPDRFVGEIGMLEIKSPSEWVHMGYLLKSGKAYDKYIVQCQGQLLVCLDREWTDIMSYHPELPEALIRIERDEKYQKLLDEAVREFSAELETAWVKCQESGWSTKVAARPMSAQAALIRDLKASLVEAGRPE